MGWGGGPEGINFPGFLSLTSILGGVVSFPSMDNEEPPVDLCLAGLKYRKQKSFLNKSLHKLSYIDCVNSCGKYNYTQCTTSRIKSHNSISCIQWCVPTAYIMEHITCTSPPSIRVSLIYMNLGLFSCVSFVSPLAHNGQHLLPELGVDGTVNVEIDHVVDIVYKVTYLYEIPVA